MLYLLLVIMPVSAYLIFQILYLRELKKHDLHLYEFCALRREAIGFLDSEYKKLSRNDYIALRKLIDALNTTIHSYEFHKTVLFNFRLFVKYLGELKSFDKKAEKISTNNPELQRLLCKMESSVVRAFLSYTPFLKSEIIVSLMIHILSAFAKSGIQSFKYYAANISEAVHLLESRSYQSNKI